MKNCDLICFNIGELVTVAGENAPRLREKMGHLEFVKNAAIAVIDGRIVGVGTEEDVLKNWKSECMLDAKGCLVTPGFVDPHTHPVFAGSRENEFAMRVAGKTYLEIAEAGGGIRNSVKRFQQSSKEELRPVVLGYLNRFLKLGTTTIEAKSGYGLSTAAELLSLELLEELKEEVALDIIPTFLGAHDIPAEFRENPKEYVRILQEEMIPAVAERKLAKYCDIFCEKGVFELEDSRKILETAREYGFLLKLHADELSPLGGAELAASLKAVSADHLVAISDQGIKDMAEAGVVAVLLPATTFFLGSCKYAPARKMVEAGVPVALATDFNPGSCMTQSMPLVLTIACLYLRLSIEEVFVATTINSACAIGMEKEVGSLMVGKKADFVLWNASHYSYLPYHFGDNLVRIVVKAGKVVVDNG
ncbi:MAG: imidazolonepropionase [Planctomycetes bacterium]|jgi:imidazolonepropionase|nr:imidazolonepropionase [Planctomycetota bacterium]